jgi:hypothetical protein
MADEVDGEPKKKRGFWSRLFGRRDDSRNDRNRGDVPDGRADDSKPVRSPNRD